MLLAETAEWATQQQEHGLQRCIWINTFIMGDNIIWGERDAVFESYMWRARVKGCLEKQGQGFGCLRDREEGGIRGTLAKKGVTAQLYRAWSESIENFGNRRSQGAGLSYREVIHHASTSLLSVFSQSLSLSPSLSLKVGALKHWPNILLDHHR